MADSLIFEVRPVVRDEPRQRVARAWCRPDGRPRRGPTLRRDECSGQGCATRMPPAARGGISGAAPAPSQQLRRRRTYMAGPARAGVRSHDADVL